MTERKKISAFTIMEIMVVIVILGAVAGFALPNYGKAVERSYQSDATNQLSAINTANQILFARTRSYWPTVVGVVNDINTINAALSINIIPNGMTYSCNGNGATYTCTATRTTGTFAVQVNQNPLQVSVPPNNATDNPRCISGSSCP